MYAADDILHFGEFHWLGHDVLETCFQRARMVFRIAVAGHRDQADITGIGQRSEFAWKFEAGFFARQHQVAENQLGHPAFRLFDAGTDGAGDFGGAADDFQQIAKQFRQVAIVFNDENVWSFRCIGFDAGAG